jgi:peptidoglycan/xylan/chitin deacetylase (PgdA/CDA1 family)
LEPVFVSHLFYTITFEIMYPVKTPRILRWPFPEMVWKVKTKKKEVFLTFDDGPIPEVTPWVIEQLKAYDATAMFFMVGDNIDKYIKVYQHVLDSGNGVGHHTQNHLVGWNTGLEEYLENVELCACKMESSFFRPPHGRIKKSQIKALKEKYNLIMWDVLSGDFDQDTSAEKCISNVLDKISPGSIIVFHDSIKAWPRLERALPEILRQLKEKGYSFGDLRDYYK